MEKTYPNKLQKGDLIKIIAPARSLSIIAPENQKIARDNLEKLGLKIEFGKHTEESDLFRSSSIESRIADLHEAFQNPDIKAVIAVIGGFNSNQLLKFIDWEIIRKNPKIFCGYSDITALNNAIYAKTGLVNYSGPSFSSFGKIKDNNFTIESFRKCIFSNEYLELAPSEKWDNRDWWKDQKNNESFTNEGWHIIQAGEVSGTIIGGNLCTLNLLQGTEYMPPLKDTILFIEDDYESNAENFDRDLQSLIHQPDFDQVRGIVIGRFETASKVTNEMLEQIIKSKKELVDIPVVSGVDFGHTSPMITFPVGGEVKIVADKEKSSIIITKH